MLVFDNNIAALNTVLTQVSSSITSLAVSVRHARNSMCGVNRLPFDIMHTIFHFATQLAREPFTEDLDGNNLAPHRQALRLSQVCSHWRAITLEQRTLWSYLDVTKMSKSCLQLFQQRSGRCPLTVVCPVWYKTRWEEFWEDPMVRSRIKTLELSLPPAGAHSRARSPCGSWSAPLLEKLHLSNYGAPMPLPHVFPIGASRLRELHVNGFGIERWSGTYRNLTVLCLTDTRLSYQLPERHLDDVLQMIGDSPNLERLEYALLSYTREPSARPAEDNLWSSEPPLTTSSTQRIALYHLTKCRLVMPTSKLAAYLLEQITYSHALRHLSVDVWGNCDVADLLRPEVIPSWLLRQRREPLFVPCSPKYFETYHLTSYLALVERSETAALDGSFLLGWGSERPLHDEIRDIMVALDSNYPALPNHTQDHNFGNFTQDAKV